MATEDTTVHAVEAPLPHPTRQAADLVELHQESSGGDRLASIAKVREIVADDVAHPDPRMWKVTGYDEPMTGGAYHALVLTAVNRLDVAEAEAAARETSERMDLLGEILQAAAGEFVIVHFERREDSFRVWPVDNGAPFSVAVMP